MNEKLHSSDPDYYERPLSEEAQRTRANLEDHYDRLSDSVENAKPIQRLKIRHQMERVERMLSWQGADPRILDRKELKEVNTAPIHDNAVTDAARARVKNPKTAIRAYCTVCMSGQPQLIRECESLRCPLWPFRMGTDPFRGFALPKAEDPIIEDETDDEDAELFADEDDNDDTE